MQTEVGAEVGIDEVGIADRRSIRRDRGAFLDGLSGRQLDDVATVTHPILNLKMPTSCPGVPSELLNPRGTWSDPEAYDAAALKLRDMFRDNFRAKDFAALGIEERI